jgi:hypothetical protein
MWPILLFQPLMEPSRLAPTDISTATRAAVTGVIEAGDEIGTHASKAFRDVRVIQGC